MNLDFQALLEQVLKAPARTKLVVLLSVLAVVAAVAIGGWVSGRPHFVKLYSDLPDAERVAVEKALAGGSVRYRVSDPPGPFVVYVDESQYDQAQIAVAVGEALKQAPKGIDSGTTGAATIFMSSGERAQTMQKREWQEAERLLERLDFVSKATVTTSMPDTNPLREKKPVMVSVVLELRGAQALSDEQAANVARVVRYRFGAPPENVVITDQGGRTLYDPSVLESHETGVRDVAEQSARFDEELARKANEHLERAYGPHKALVSVTSQWNHDQTTILDEKVDPETVARETETRTSELPQGSSAAPGGPTGFGNESAAVPQGAAPGATAVLSKTKDEKKVFDASRSRTQTVRTAPRLEHLSVSLVIDESLAAKKDEVQKVVEAAVGYDPTRKDTIGVSVTTLAAPAVGAPLAGAPEAAAPAAPDAGPSPMLQMLLERGVEIVSALGFLFLLVTSLRGGKKAAVRAGAAAPASGSSGAAGAPAGHDAESAPVEVEIDPDALARAQIEELVRTDPRRVGEILSRWVDDKSPARAGR